MPAPDISALPEAPQRTDVPSVFVSKADAFVASLPTFRSQVNAFGDYLDSLALSGVTGPITSTALTVSSGKLLGRSSSGTGAIQELTVGSGLSLTAGTLSATGGSGTVTNVATSGLATGGPITGTGTITVTAADAAAVRTGTSTTTAVTPAALSGSAAAQTLTDGATINWNMASGYNAKVTLGGNRTLATPTNPIEGLTYTLAVIQDGTGSRTMTWPASFDWGTTGAPTLTTTAAKVDQITLQCTDSATPKFRAVLSGKGFAS